MKGGNAPRAHVTYRTPKKLYEHMEKEVKPVLEVCPNTGAYIDPKPIDIKLVVNHHFKRVKSIEGPLKTFIDKGVHNLTKEELDKAYKIIKGWTCNKAI